MVRLERPNGPTSEILTPFYWYPEAEARLGEEQRASAQPKLLGLATCAKCLSSDEGCERCNPEGEPIPGR